MASSTTAVIAWYVTLLSFSQARAPTENSENTPSFESGVLEKMASWESGTTRRKSGSASSKPSSPRGFAPSSPEVATPLPSVKMERSSRYSLPHPLLSIEVFVLTPLVFEALRAIICPKLKDFVPCRRYHFQFLFFRCWRLLSDTNVFRSLHLIAFLLTTELRGMKPRCGECRKNNQYNMRFHVLT